MHSAVLLSRQRELSELEKQGLIQAFEFTHELAWKTLKDFLESRGAAGIFGSRDVTRKAFAAGLIPDGEVWMEMILNRNRSSHTYNLALAASIVGAVVGQYARQFELLEKQLKELESTSP